MSKSPWSMLRPSQLAFPFVLLAAAGVARCGDSGPEGSTIAGNGGSSGDGSAAGGSGGTVITPPDAGGDSGASGCSGDACPPDAGPACGDGKIDPGELCDDANGDSGDGCAANCDAIEQGFACPTPGQPCVSTVQCGDGKINGGETCDDGNASAGDGCGNDCTVEPGWKCPTAGAAGEAAQCGDGLLAGKEKCDDGNGDAGDGCSPQCALEKGFKCPTPGSPCVATVCGDGVAEGTEQCDDGNHDMGDGCTPFCVKEPDCSAGACKSTCGDGLKLPTDQEECEDGNTLSGDGCSSNCKIEPGYTCTDAPAGSVNQLVLPTVIRDFKISHPDFQYVVGVDYGIVTSMLGPDGKPVYANSTGTTPTTTGKANFDQWYRDVPGVNFTVLQSMTLDKLGSGEFQFSNAAYFPIDNQAFGNEGNVHNFHFTSEVRYWFEYKGGEKLDFTGDDDVWVFVNKQRAIDLGGVHGAMSAQIVLDTAAAASFGLELGKVYEIVVFQAERHTTQSNYKLTLTGFVSTESSCQSNCGDGIKTPDEACDDGKNDGSYGSCTADCKLGPHCGDAVVQASAGEECDDGVNLTPYGGCAPGCKLGGKCGDGKVDSLFGEQCDDGVNDGGYGECGAGCVLGPRCGDGVVQPANGEECDDGNKLGGDGCSASCTKEGPA
jgi:fibro-slime domain-containing protein